MSTYHPFHPALPNPTGYFAGQKRMRRLRIAAGIGIFIGVVVVIFFWASLTLSNMPLPDIQ